MMTTVVIDANVLVGLLDGRDKWHGAATAIREALDNKDVEIAYFDCVLNEAISVLARRTHEQKRHEELSNLLDQLSAWIPATRVTWVSVEIPRLYEQILQLIRRSGGVLNFHDALIALVCREQGVPVVVSFDRDFDAIEWLTRIGTAAEVGTVLP
jgi:predicted nucleic acid-binding protein